MLGVQLDGPVWNNRLVIEPRLGDLTSAEGVVVTAFGPVPVSWKRQGRELSFRFEVPKGVQAMLRLPDGDTDTLILDNRQPNTRRQRRHVCVSVMEGVHQGLLMMRSAPATSYRRAFNE